MRLQLLQQPVFISLLSFWRLYSSLANRGSSQTGFRAGEISAFSTTAADINADNVI